MTSVSEPGRVEEGGRRVRPGTLLAVAVGLALAALFAWNVRRTAFLGDDAFITFRYARHLAEGLGPCWNAGERVEGYTNFSWMLLLAAGMRVGLAPETLSNVLGVASGATLLVGLTWFTLRARPRSLAPWLLLAVVVANRSFAAWCTGGLETMFFALLAFLAFARLVAPWRGRDALLCGLLFALAALTRPEGLLFAALAGAVLLLDVVQHRRTARALVQWLAPLVVIVAAHFAWRRAYYGAWLPNTFHAKVAGLWLEQGRRYFAYFHDGYRIGWFLPLALVAGFGPHRRIAATFAFVLAVYGAYVLAVGGDVFELRFFVHVFPLLYWLLVEGLAVLATAGRGRTRVASAGLAACIGAALLATTWLGFERVSANLYAIQSVDGIDHYTRERMDEGLFLRERIEQGVLPRALVLACGGAGALPYYTDWETIDRRGLNDATIARMPVERRGFVGHEHDAPYEYLVARRVAVFDVNNQLVVKLRSLPQRREPVLHDGRPLAMRAIPLGERALFFATFLADDELAQLFAGQEIVVLSGP